jgi:hypothetical protein
MDVNLEARPSTRLLSPILSQIGFQWLFRKQSLLLAKGLPTTHLEKRSRFRELVSASETSGILVTKSHRRSTI